MNSFGFETVSATSSTPAQVHGPEIRPDGTTCFRLWAPAVDRVEIEIEGTRGVFRMCPREDGWHELITDQATRGTQYRFRLPNGMLVPDPASRYQPVDVHGPSEIVDTSSWTWKDSQWNNRPWHEAVIYELHVGSFTPEGTFLSAIVKLDHIAALGATAIELMPIADFPGRRNWGYDGALLYAPDSSYGRPEDLKLLVEAAHARGLMVLLDVVYNHLGPEGNYLNAYAPGFFTERHTTPWGAAINFDGPESRAVRGFFVQNAIYWLREYHMDGLRLDAVNTIRDDSPRHILYEIAECVRGAVKHEVHLILENEENQASLLERDLTMKPVLYTAQWNDDVHHVLHTALTDERHAYYADYGGDTVKLARGLAEGFVFQGEVMSYREATRGQECNHLQSTAFISFLQNHDQIGNRAFGDRIGQSASPEALRAVSSVYLLLPEIPMVFMGEEWNCSSPFPFFSDFGPELSDAVREGRRREFAGFPGFRDPAQRDEIPDPQAESTFLSSKLLWEERNRPPNREWLSWYRQVLARRHEMIVPLLRTIGCGGTFTVVGEGAVMINWAAGSRRELILAANLSGDPVGGFPREAGHLIWKEGEVRDAGTTLMPWTVIWSVREKPG